MWKHLVTDYDNETWDTARFALYAVLGVFLFLELWSVMVRGEPFRASEFGYGIGGILTGFGFSVAGDNFRRPPPFGGLPQTRVRETYRTTQQTEVVRPPRPSEMD